MRVEGVEGLCLSVSVWYLVLGSHCTGCCAGIKDYCFLATNNGSNGYVSERYMYCRKRCLVVAWKEQTGNTAHRNKAETRLLSLSSRLAVA